MRFQFITILFYLINSIGCYSKLIDYYWLNNFYKITKILYSKCSSNSNLNELENCIRNKSLFILDGIINKDSIEIVSGVSLLKENASNNKLMLNRR